MEGFLENIKEKALTNAYFRQVLETGRHTQIVIMSVPPGGDIGDEIHADTDQILYFVKGTCKGILDGEEQNLKEEDVVLVKQGTRHNFINTGNEDLKIITSYSPPHHPAGTIHRTKEEAARTSY